MHQWLNGQYHERSSKFLCKLLYARIIEVQSLINKITFKQQKGVNSF